MAALDILTNSLDHMVEFGQPWHGAISGTTLTRDTDGGTQTVPAVPDPHTLAVALPGLPDPAPPTADMVAAGAELRKTAILIGINRWTTPGDRGASSHQFGRTSHVYRAADGSQFVITVTPSIDTTTTIAPGGTRALGITVSAKRMADTQAGTILSTAVTVTNPFTHPYEPGPYSLYLYPRPVWTVPAPSGNRVAVMVGGGSFTGTVTSGEARQNELGLAAVEVILSGGSVSNLPTAVIGTQVNAPGYTITARTYQPLTSPLPTEDYSGVLTMSMPGTYGWGIGSNPTGSNYNTTWQGLYNAGFDDSDTLRVLIGTRGTSLTRTASIAGSMYLALYAGAAVDWTTFSTATVVRDEARYWKVAGSAAGDVDLSGVWHWEGTRELQYAYIYDSFVSTYVLNMRQITTITSETGAPTQAGFIRTVSNQGVALWDAFDVDGQKRTRQVVTPKFAGALVAVSPNLNSYTSTTLPWVAVNPLTGAMSATPGESFI